MIIAKRLLELHLYRFPTYEEVSDINLWKFAQIQSYLDRKFSRTRILAPRIDLFNINTRGDFVSLLNPPEAYYEALFFIMN